MSAAVMDPVRPLRSRIPILLAAAVLVASGCMNGGVLRAPVPTSAPAPAASPTPLPASDPVPLSFPRDEGPHHRLTEWWYYTGHLAAADGRRFGFEFVVFRAERGDFPVAWASHFAVTDDAADTFSYAQRSDYGPQVDRSPAEGGFDLVLEPPAAGIPTPTSATPPDLLEEGNWTMRGAGGLDHLTASGTPGAIDLDLSTDRPPVLHNGSGWIDLGPAGGTYYYSRTRMDVSGTLGLSGQTGPPLPVTGLAWFDHQWGDFIAVGAGGWDWFSVQLADGRDLMISNVRGPNGATVLRYGTLVAADGRPRDLGSDDLVVTVLRSWQSPRSGANYPAEWRVALPREGLTLHLAPTVADQELDTTDSTGVVYWEGEVAVDGIDGGRPIAGSGYVELTGYAK